MTQQTEDKRTESVRSAWTRAVRQEALRMRHSAVSRIVGIGILIATYADADGTNCFPGSEALAAVAGSSRETIGRAVKVLVAVGLMERKRGQGTKARYTLLMPIGPVDWDGQLWRYTNTRQKARRERIKNEEFSRRMATLDPTDHLNPFTPAYWAANPDSDWRPLGDPDWTPPTPDPSWEAFGTAMQDAVRTAFPAVYPHSVPDGDSAERSRRGLQDPGQRSRTPPDHVAERCPDSVPDGGVHIPVDPPTDTDMVWPVAQPQVGAREVVGNDDSSPPDLHAIDGGGKGGGRVGQAPLLMSVQDPAPLDHALIAAHMTALYGTPVPVRLAATTAVQMTDHLDLPDPTAYVLAALDADPGRYRPPLPAAEPARNHRAAGTA